MGFWVPMTRWGRGRGHDSPSTDTCCSSMASRSADWVHGGVRLSSSRRTTCPNTGPGRKSHVPVSGENTVTPVMSDGSRSGLPCTRDSWTPSAVARARASTVLPTPGTSSMSRWLPDRAATTARVTARGRAQQHLGQRHVQVPARGHRLVDGRNGSARRPPGRDPPFRSRCSVLMGSPASRVPTRSEDPGAERGNPPTLGVIPVTVQWPGHERRRPEGRNGAVGPRPGDGHRQRGGNSEVKGGQLGDGGLRPLPGLEPAPPGPVAVVVGCPGLHHARKMTRSMSTACW